MAWIVVDPVNGPSAYINTDSIAYVADPPEGAAERGIGAGIAFLDNTREVIPVKQKTSQIIMDILGAEVRQK